MTTLSCHGKRIASCLLLAWVLLPTLGLTQEAGRAPQQANDASAVTAREIAYIESVAAAALTEQERQQIAHDMAIALQTAPAAMATYIRAVEKALAAMRSGQPGDVEAARAQSRLGIATASPGDVEPLATTERRIVDAHDPVLVHDAAGKRLVTERTLVVLRSAAAWTAQAAGIPGPDATFTDKARQNIRSSFAQLIPEQSNGFAHMGQYVRDEPGFFSALPPDKRAAFFAKKRAEFAALPASWDKQWWLATITAGIVEDAHNLQAVRIANMRNQVLLMNNMMFGQMMQQQQRNFGHAMRREPFGPN